MSVPLRVGIDVSPLVQTQAGTARALRELLPRLEPSVQLRRYALDGGGRAAALARDVLWYPRTLPRRARRDRVDLLHCPTFRAPFSASVPLVVTVHDLAVLRFPWAFNRWSATWGPRTLPRVLRAASAVLAVSEFTKRELVDLLGVPESRVAVVPNGVGEPFSPHGPAAEGEYLLAVSTLEPRKNLPRLLEAFARLRRRRPGLELVIAGARGWGGVRVEGEGVRWLGCPDDQELARLYRGARCLLYPSLYEGFGLPVLEAMACGTPVVASRAQALRELSAEDAAVHVDAFEPDAIVRGIEQALDRRDELRTRGLERAQAFGWDETARLTLSVYEQVAG